MLLEDGEELRGDETPSLECREGAMLKYALRRRSNGDLSHAVEGKYFIDHTIDPIVVFATLRTKVVCFPSGAFAFECPLPLLWMPLSAVNVQVAPVGLNL